MKKLFKDTPYMERLTESQLEPFQTQEKILSLERLYDAAKKKELGTISPHLPQARLVCDTY